MRYWVVVFTLTLSCVRGNVEEPPGYPLYSNSGARLPRDQVAELQTSMPGGASVGGGSSSFIEMVDGKDVSTTSASFELLPGCHLVKTASRLVIANPTLIWHGQMGHKVFALQMKAGNTYVVKLDLIDHGDGTARSEVYAIEQDAAGSRVQRIEPVKSADEIRGCQGAGGQVSSASPAVVR